MTMFCKTIPMPLGRLSPTATRRGRFKKVSFDQLLLQCIVSFGSHPMCKLLEQIPSPMLTLFLIQNIPQYISISMMSPSLDLLCPSHTSLPPVPNFFLLFLFFSLFSLLHVIFNRAHKGREARATSPSMHPTLHEYGCGIRYNTYQICGYALYQKKSTKMVYPYPCVRRVSDTDTIRHPLGVSV